MGLKASLAYRCLDRKTTVFGFEIADLFASFALLALLNLAFDSMPCKALFTWCPAFAFAAFLRLGKAGKPENYLLHLLKYNASPGVFAAFPAASRMKVLVQTKKGEFT